MIELLVVMAIVAILAALLLPTLAGAKARSQRIACANQLKQFGLSLPMYAADNSEKLVRNDPPPGSPGVPDPATNNWVNGDMKNAAQSTNTLLIRQGQLFPYASNPGLYHCPSDKAQTAGLLHVRSFAMNGWMGSRSMDTAAGSPAGPGRFRTFVKENEVAAAGSSTLWVITDEHEASIDDGRFLVTMNDSQPFASFPGTRHQHGYSLNFADSHVEYFKLRDPTSIGPQIPVSYFNTDWIRLKQVTTR